MHDLDADRAERNVVATEGSRGLAEHDVPRAHLVFATRSRTAACATQTVTAAPPCDHQTTPRRPTRCRLPRRTSQPRRCHTEECEPGPARLSITDCGRAVIESGLTLRQAHDRNRRTPADQLWCDRRRKDFGTGIRDPGR